MSLHVPYSDEISWTGRYVWSESAQMLVVWVDPLHEQPKAFPGDRALVLVRKKQGGADLVRIEESASGLFDRTGGKTMHFHFTLVERDTRSARAPTRGEQGWDAYREDV
jgi:hypothetical protein